MNNPKFEEGAWVKVKDGTKGMTVVSNVSSGADFSGKVLCKYADENGHDVQKEFDEDELVVLE